MRSRLGLNGLNFFTAAVQAGFGPFIAVWLTLSGWTLGALGLALSIGTFAALLGQLPGGMLVDEIHRKRIPAAGALIALGAGALMLCLAPTQKLVFSAQILHGLASCVMTPAIAALTLSICGHDSYGERLGQNTRYASLGNAASAALLGAAAAVISERAVFLVTAALVVPALASLFMIRMADCADPEDDHSALRHPREREHKPWQIFADPTLHVFAAAVVLFQLANAALLPIALSGLTRGGGAPGLVVSATIIVPQIVTALLAPWAGTLAQRIGRRPVLMVGFAAVPLRALLFAVVPGALPLTVLQALDGVSAAVFGLMLPLIAADLTRRTGFLNLAIGALGLASGLGATCATLIAGWIGTRFGEATTFLLLAAVGVTAVGLLGIAMPETRRPRPAA
ncbi:MFS transporter [Rhodopila sp.]|uniref:MFS transporter n=1 Tax=Rhodopila sp. TaxID=2480087 RepID=UPI003D0FBE85